MLVLVDPVQRGVRHGVRIRQPVLHPLGKVLQDELSQRFLCFGQGVAEGGSVLLHHPPRHRFGGSKFSYDVVVELLQELLLQRCLRLGQRLRAPLRLCRWRGRLERRIQIHILFRRLLLRGVFGSVTHKFDLAFQPVFHGG